jgi:hypothetical protein
VRHLGTESTSWSDRPGSREMALKRSLKGDDSEKESQVRHCVCLLLFAGGGGGEWRTCAMRHLGTESTPWSDPTGKHLHVCASGPCGCPLYG